MRLDTMKTQPTGCALWQTAGQVPAHNRYVSDASRISHTTAKAARGSGTNEKGGTSFPARQNNHIKDTSGAWAAVRRWQRRKDP